MQYEKAKIDPKIDSKIIPNLGQISQYQGMLRGFQQKWLWFSAFKAIINFCLLKNIPSI